MIFALPLEPLYNIFTVRNKIKVSSIALISFSAASVLSVFVGLSFIQGENAKIIYIAAVGAFYNVVRLISFLPIYGAKCLDFKLTTFYPVIAKNVLSVIVLSGIAIALNIILSIKSWILLFLGCVIVGLIGIITNVLILFSRDEVFILLDKIREFVRKRNGEV